MPKETAIERWIRRRRARAWTVDSGDEHPPLRREFRPYPRRSSELSTACREGLHRRKSLGRGPVQDADVGPAKAVLIAEIAPLQQLNTHGPEIIRHHDRDVARRPVR